MSRAQRVVLFIYCLLIVYCCVWVPWHGFRSEIGEVQYGSVWLWSGHGRGGPDVVTIVRLVAASALGAAAFLLARKWKAILSAAIIAGLGCAGILLYGYWTDRVAERRTQKIHDCAVAKVATAKCTSPNAQGDIVDQVAREAARPGKTPGTDSKATGQYTSEDIEVAVANIFDPVEQGATRVDCDRYWLSDNPTAQEEDTAIAAAEKECAGEIDPKQKSSHEQIEEYKRQHGIKQ